IEQRPVGDDAELVHLVVRIDTELALYRRDRGRVVRRAVAEGIESRRRIGIRQRLIERRSGDVVESRTLLVDALARERLHRPAGIEIESQPGRDEVDLLLASMRRRPHFVDEGILYRDA